MEEILILESIYGDEWKTIDDKVYSIEIKENSKVIEFQCSLAHEFPKEYIEFDPEQQISVSEYHSSYYRRENIGEQVIYTWIECIRDYLSTDVCDHVINSTSSNVCDVPPAIDQLTSEISDAPEIFSTEIITDRKSRFQGHLARISEFNQVNIVMSVLLSDRKIASATHNIAAYRITDREEHLDDGEKGASVQMLRLMQMVDAKDVMIVVTRWYGGIQLGPDRFKHINALCKHLLDEHDFIIRKVI